MDWVATTIDEQADDAVALLGALGLAPAIVLGTSAATGILASMCLRSPDVLRGAIFHEPLIPSGASNIDAVRGGRRVIIEDGMARGGPRLATELFLRSVATDQIYESLDPHVRDRLLDNADVLFGIEMAPFVAYQPTADELGAVRVPCVVTAGADGRDPSSRGHWRYEVAQWLAGHLRTSVADLPGGHMAYLGEPVSFAEALRPVLRTLT